MDIDRLVATFEFLDDWEERYATIIGLGKKLAPMDDSLKTEATKVHGCQSQVWMVHEKDAEGRFHFIADSDAHIVRGLIAILLMIYEGKTREEIAAVPIADHFARLGLDRHLSPLRSNGLHAMVARIRAAE
ncbi:MAG: SufE family protein [Planctomycetota bacterium]